VSPRLTMFRRSLVAAALATMCCSSTAHARRGLMLITTGNTVKHVGDVLPDMKESVREGTGQAEDLKVGYLHDRFGLFWVDIWTWNGQYVLYNSSDDVWELDDEQAASVMGVTGSQLKKPFFYTVPPGLVAICILGSVWGYTASRQRKRHKAERAELEEAASDPRFQRALAIIAESSKQAAEGVAPGGGEGDAAKLAAGHQAAYDRAVQTLVEQGIPREDADRKLWMLLSASQPALTA